MDNQINLLIYLYEEEKLRLQKLIEECLVETEYLMAHHYSQALYKLNGRLQTLKKIDDKFLDERDRIRRRIDRLQKQMEIESETYI